MLSGGLEKRNKLMHAGFYRWRQMKKFSASWEYEPPVDIVRPSEQSQPADLPGCKTCKVCGETKPLSEFNKNHGKICKKCESKRNAENRKYMLQGLKYCKTCKEWKPLEEFPVSVTEKSGRHWECEACATKKEGQWLDECIVRRAARNPKLRKQIDEELEGKVKITEEDED